MKSAEQVRDENDSSGARLLMLDEKTAVAVGYTL